MKKITIINAYGEKNIGDAAILKIAVDLIKEAHGKDVKLSILSENTKLDTEFVGMPKNVTVLQLPYGYAISGNKKVSGYTKLLRFITIYVNTYRYIYLHKLLNEKLPTKGFYSYIHEIKSADAIIGMGGGYFTTNNKYTDSFGLFLTLLPVYIAKTFHKKILFLPMSFGPFASTQHENATYHSLRKTTVISRDDITLKRIKSIDKQKKIKTFYAPDLALFYKGKTVAIVDKMKSNYIIVTAREWFSDVSKQNSYEESLVALIKHASQKHNLRTIFVPMARNTIEDDDNRVARRIKHHINDENIFSLYKPKSIVDLQDLLARARIAVCTRMHSAILSTTVGTPFIAIGYGHKTLGFVKTFDLENWHVDIKEVNSSNIISLADRLLEKNHYSEFIDKIIKKNKSILEYKDTLTKEISYQII